MGTGRYVAYVGTYTYGSSEGIHILDIDSDTWQMKERKSVPINNPSDVHVAHNKKYLYAISDDGVQSYRVLPDGDLEFMNSHRTGGMRGCYLDTDPEDRFLFVAGYHDGRVSVLHLLEDGTVGDIADGIFHKGIGLSITDRRSMPHVTCVQMTPDYKGICAVDCGLDQVKIYDVSPHSGQLRLNDIIRCEMESSPRMIRVDPQRKFVYILGEMSNRVCVYRAVPDSEAVGKDKFELVQRISTIDNAEHSQAAASGIEFTSDGKYLFVCNAGINSVIVFEVDPETGMLSRLLHNKCGGDYPKALAIMPDDEHFVTLSHNTNEILSYKINYEKKYFLMTSRPVHIETPNSICIHELA